MRETHRLQGYPEKGTQDRLAGGKCLLDSSRIIADRYLTALIE